MIANYQSRLNRHLGRYRETVLGLHEQGCFTHRGITRSYEHILPLHASEANLLPDARSGANEIFLKQPRTKHKYFHHLNSSQAFAFNLFLPYLTAKPEKHRLLLSALGISGDLLRWKLEAVPDLIEETNVDALLATSTETIYCEVKLSEQQFGGAKKNQSHLDKLKNVYEPRLRTILPHSCLEPKAFFKHYQFYRYIWHIAGPEAHRMIFLLPEENRMLWVELHRLLGYVDQSIRHRISAVSIEGLLSRLIASEAPLDLQERYAVKLEQKYIPAME